MRRSKNHGLSRAYPREWAAWRAARNRCIEAAHPSFENYGGRGITMCREWLDDFPAFFAHMGPCPAGKQLDREDNDGDYTPRNCRWATPQQQARNKRTSRLVSHDGRTLTIAEWSERTGVSYNAIKNRLERGWQVAAALTTPTGRRGGNRRPKEQR